MNRGFHIRKVSTASAVQTIVLAESSLHHRRPHVILNIYSVGLGVDLNFFFLNYMGVPMLQTGFF